jgi:hypothetical protein
MSGRSRGAPVGMGFGSRPAAPSTASPPANQVRQKILEVLDAAKEGVDVANAIRAANAAKETPGQGAPTLVPQPASLSDAVNAATGIVSIHKGAADTALQMADAERDRRIEAEERAGNAFAQGEAEADGRWKAMQAMVAPLQAKLDSMMERGHQAELEAKEAGFKAELANLNAKLDAVLRAKDAEIAAQKAIAEKLGAQVEELKQRETLDGFIGKAIAGGEIDPRKVEMLRRLFGWDQQAALTPEQEASRAWLTGQVQHRLTALKNEEERRDVTHQEVVQLIGEGRQVLSALRGVLGPLLSRSVAGGRLPGSVVPAAFPDPPPADGGQAAQ